MNAIRKCAYCDFARPLTREHIWPAGFLRRKEYGIKYSAKSKKTFRGDLTIKDVCAECNNGPLSFIDKYACNLFDRFFNFYPDQLGSVLFNYDYGSLARWLLKIAYNTSRASESPDSVFLSRYRSYLLERAEAWPINVGFKLALVGPSYLPGQSGSLPKVILPEAVRSGPLGFESERSNEHVALRAVMVNSYFFTIILPRRPAVPIAEVAPLIQRLPGEPLSYAGIMDLHVSLNAFQALNGVQRWPRNVDARR